MNQTRITLHVCADERMVAARMAVRSVEIAMFHGNGHSSGQSDVGSWRCDIETITVPDDDASDAPEAK